MEDKFVLHGPECLEYISEECLGVQCFESLWKNRHLPTAFIDAVTEESISYSTLFETTCILADSLENYGIKENKIVAICSENILEYFYPVIASLYVGATVTTFSPSYTPRELKHVADISKPDIIFCSRQTFPTVMKTDIAPTIVIINSMKDIQNVQCLDSFIKANTRKAFYVANYRPTFCSVDNVAFILYSSGTTGLPKGVMMAHRSFNIKSAIHRNPRYSGDLHNKSTIGLIPFYHAYGLSVIFRDITLGGMVVVLRKFDEYTYLKVIQDYKISVLYLVPPLVVVLSNSTLLDKFDLSSVTVAACGGASLSKHAEKVFTKRFNLKFIWQAYGMTETGVGVTSSTNYEHKEGSCGKLLPFTLGKIVDIKTGKSLGPYKTGEMCFKAPYLMKGYVGSQKATKDIFDDEGWLHTGDVGYYDEDNFLYITGRLKELIKYKGFQVPPAELEAILISHPKIKDAGVVGLPDELAGELPAAFVVKEDKSLTSDEVKKFIEEHVSPQKYLRGGVQFVSEIPRNASGKILRQKLKELLQAPKSKL